MIHFPALTELKEHYRERERFLNNQVQIGFDSKTMSDTTMCDYKARASECRDIVYRIATMEHQLENGFIPVKIEIGATNEPA